MRNILVNVTVTVRAGSIKARMAVSDARVVVRTPAIDVEVSG